MFWRPRRMSCLLPRGPSLHARAARRRRAQTRQPERSEDRQGSGPRPDRRDGGAKRSTADQGGVQPADHPTGQRAGPQGRESSRSEGLQGSSFSSTGSSTGRTSGPLNARSAPRWKTVFVELWGLEPQTSSMPWRRATNCAIAPCSLRAPVYPTPRPPRHAQSGEAGPWCTWPGSSSGTPLVRGQRTESAMEMRSASSVTIGSSAVPASRRACSPSAGRSRPNACLSRM